MAWYTGSSSNAMLRQAWVCEKAHCNPCGGSCSSVGTNISDTFDGINTWRESVTASSGSVNNSSCNPMWQVYFPEIVTGQPGIKVRFLNDLASNVNTWSYVIRYDTPAVTRVFESGNGPYSGMSDFIFLSTGGTFDNTYLLPFNVANWTLTTIGGNSVYNHSYAGSAPVASNPPVLQQLILNLGSGENLSQNVVSFGTTIIYSM